MGPLDMARMARHTSVTRALGKYGKVTIQEFATRFSDPFLREVFPQVMEGMPDLSMTGTLSTLAE